MVGSSQNSFSLLGWTFSRIQSCKSGSSRFCCGMTGASGGGPSVVIPPGLSLLTSCFTRACGMWGGLLQACWKELDPKPWLLPSIRQWQYCQQFSIFQKCPWSTHTSFTTAEQSQIKLLQVFALEIPQGDASLEKVLTML